MRTLTESSGFTTAAWAAVWNNEARFSSANERLSSAAQRTGRGDHAGQAARGHFAYDLGHAKSPLRSGCRGPLGDGRLLDGRHPKARSDPAGPPRSATNSLAGRLVQPLNKRGPPFQRSCRCFSCCCSCSCCRCSRHMPSTWEISTRARAPSSVSSAAWPVLRAKFLWGIP